MSNVAYIIISVGSILLTNLIRTIAEECWDQSRQKIFGEGSPRGEGSNYTLHGRLGKGVRGGSNEIFSRNLFLLKDNKIYHLFIKKHIQQMSMHIMTL